MLVKVPGFDLQRSVLAAIVITFAAWAPFQSPAGELTFKVINPSPQIDDNFGQSFTAVGGNILVSAPRDSEESPAGGAVYLMNGQNGDLLQTFRSPSGNPSAFGRAVATLSGQDILISGWDHDALVSSGTIARIYHYNVESGSLVNTFAPPNTREVSHLASPLWLGATTS